MINNELKKEHIIQIIPVKKEHADFINTISNNNQLMRIFHENATKLSDWQYVIEEWLNDEDEKDFIIVREEDKLQIGWIGINGLQSKDKNAWIKMIAILPDYWGKSYGSSAINTIKSMLKEIGYKKLSLWTDECNIRAQIFYKKNNFKVIHKKKDTVGSKKIITYRLLMECEL